MFGSVRKDVDAYALQAELGDAFIPLVLDVENDAAIIAASVAVRASLPGRTLDGLVNNAGIALSGPLLMQTVADFRKQIEVNLVGMFAVTRVFAPLLGADPALAGPKGRIVNISSVGGNIGPPFLGAYAAAKHGVEGFSESLRRELQLVGINVIIVGPGSVATPIWDKAEAAPSTHLAGTIWERPFRTFTDYMLKDGRKGLAPQAHRRSREDGSLGGQASSTLRTCVAQAAELDRADGAAEPRRGPADPRATRIKPEASMRPAETAVERQQQQASLRTHDLLDCSFGSAVTDPLDKDSAWDVIDVLRPIAEPP